MNNKSKAEKFYRQNWSQTARNPKAWLSYAERLKQAADVLRENCWPRNRADHAHDAAGSDHCYGPVYMLVSGLAIEGIIKGIRIADKAGLVEQQRLAKEICGHDLIKLFQDVDIRKYKDDKKLLLRLQNYIENFGRYPVTKHQEGMAKRAHTHFCSVDFGKVDRFWNRLLAQYKNIEIKHE